MKPAMVKYFKRLKSDVKNSHNLITAVSIIGAFLTYFSMYAFRKPFTAAEYEGLFFLGIDFKIFLIISQVMGYTFSKFIGIRLISSMPAHARISYILGSIGVSWLALLIFAFVPPSFKVVAIFMNGLPLGLIWGLVFAFLEGRQRTELLAAGLASSFIVSSGIVKSVGLGLILEGVGIFWMPFFTGILFIPTLFLGVGLLSLIPPPSPEDEVARSERPPMSPEDRRRFFRDFAPGILVVTLIYMALNVCRDFRDNFAVEIWSALGYGDQPKILTWSEVPIAVVVLVLTALVIFVKSNQKAFYLNFVIILLGGFTLIVTTFLFLRGVLSPIVWMVSVGFGMYAAYIAYHAVLFERWIALFRGKSNIGFLMYFNDAFGYLASAGVLMFKNFGYPQMSWLNFFSYISYGSGFICLLFAGFAIAYFKAKEKSINRSSVLLPPETAYSS